MCIYIHVHHVNITHITVYIIFRFFFFPCPQYHSSSDSEVPLLRRPRVPRKRTKPKTCTSLSPLLENTNPSPMNPANTVPSSRHTPSHPPPSSLLTSYTALPTSVAAAITGSGGGTMYHNHSINDSGFVSDTSHSRIPLTTAHHENVAYHYQPPLRYQHHQPNNSNHNTSSENIYETPVKNMARHTGATPTVANGKTRYPDNWGSSPFTDHLRKTGQIQSVPPWFVCSDKRSDGKVWLSACMYMYMYMFMHTVLIHNICIIHSYGIFVSHLSILS